MVKEVNGIAVFVPEDMMIVLREAENSITFKIVPSAMDQQFSDPVSHISLGVPTRTFCVGCVSRTFCVGCVSHARLGWLCLLSHGV